MPGAPKPSLDDMCRRRWTDERPERAPLGALRSRLLGMASAFRRSTAPLVQTPLSRSSTQRPSLDRVIIFVHRTAQAYGRLHRDGTALHNARRAQQRSPRGGQTSGEVIAAAQ